MKKAIRNQQGFTLVEIIVTLVLSALLMSMVAMILPSILNIFGRTNEMAERNTMLNIAANTMLSDMQSATGVIAGTKDNMSIPTSFGTVVYTIGTGGELSRNGVELLDQGYYRNKKLSFDWVEFTTSDLLLNKWYEVTLTIIPKPGANLASSLSRNYVSAPIVLNQLE